MSIVKERIIGAVTIMNEQDAEKIWALMQSVFALENVETVDPDDDELSAIAAYRSGDPEYQPSISHEDLIKQLDI